MDPNDLAPHPHRTDEDQIGYACPDCGTAVWYAVTTDWPICGDCLESRAQRAAAIPETIPGFRIPPPAAQPRHAMATGMAPVVASRQTTGASPRDPQTPAPGAARAADRVTLARLAGRAERSWSWWRVWCW